MPRREQPMPGVEVLADGRCRALVYLGRDAKGDRKYTRRTFPDIKSANAFKRKTLDERDRGVLPVGGGTTLKALVERWLALKTDRRSASSVSTYRTALDAHVLPKLGGTRLDRLSTALLQAHFDGLGELGWEPSALRTPLAALTGALTRAVAWGLIERNPAAGVLLPVYRPANPATALSLDDARRLLAAAEADAEYGGAVALMLRTGLRVGEAAALGWSALDLDAGLLRVCRHLRKVKKNGKWTWEIAAGAKTASGARTIRLGAEAVALLRRQRARQNAWRLARGANWPDDADLVFTRQTGEFLHPSTVGAHLKAIGEGVGLEDVSPHDLRASHLTLSAAAAERSDLLALQQRAGHSQIGQTMEYLTPDTSAQERLVERLDERLRQAAD